MEAKIHEFHRARGDPSANHPPFRHEGVGALGADKALAADWYAAVARKAAAKSVTVSVVTVEGEPAGLEPRGNY